MNTTGRKPGSMSVAMDAAIKAWCIKPETTESTSQQIARFAVAHGVSVSGLTNALRAGKYIAHTPRVNQPQVPAPQP
jgi:hypothetical protein